MSAAKAAHRRSPKPARTTGRFKPSTSRRSAQVKEAALGADAGGRFRAREAGSQRLKPAPPADRRTLHAPGHFDLIGLPPTPEEVDAFRRGQSARRLTRSWWIACSPRRVTASAGGGTGSMWRATPTPRATLQEERRYPFSLHLSRLRHPRLQRGQALRSVSRSSKSPPTACRTGEDKSPLAALGFLTLGRRFLNNPERHHRRPHRRRHARHAWA